VQYNRYTKAAIFLKKEGRINDRGMFGEHKSEDDDIEQNISLYSSNNVKHRTFLLEAEKKLQKYNIDEK
jgi:hypothetical protein